MAPEKKMTFDGKVLPWIYRNNVKNVRIYVLRNQFIYFDYLNLKMTLLIFSDKAAFKSL